MNEHEIAGHAQDPIFPGKDRFNGIERVNQPSESLLRIVDERGREGNTLSCAEDNVS